MPPLLLLLCFPLACGPKTVIVNGVEMTYEEGANRLYEEGKAAEANGDLPTARARYKEVIDRFAESRMVGDALASIGLMTHTERGCGAASPFLSRLAERFPLHPRAKEAKTLLAACASSGVEPSVDQVALREDFEAAPSDPARKAVALKAADVSSAATDFGAAARWLLQARALETQPAEKARLENEITTLIDRRMSFQEIRELLEETSGNDFPKALLTYKLGRIQYHVRDTANARETLKRYLDQWPNESYAKDARALLSRLDARSRTDELAVGVVLPLSGKHRVYGEYAQQAIKLGLGKDSKIKLVVRDTQSDRVAARQAVEDLVLEHGVIAIIGPIFGYEAEPAAYKAQELGVPLLTISTASRITEAGPYVFRNGLTYEAEMAALVGHAMDILGMKSFAILHPRHPYGEDLMHLFWDEVEKRQGEIRGVESYATDDTTFSRQVKRLVARDQLDGRADYRRAIDECEKQPDVYRKARCKERVEKDLKPLIDFDGLFIPDYPRTIAMVSAALAFEDVIVEQDPRRLRVIQKTLDYEVKPITLLGGSGWNSEKLTETAGRSVESALFTDIFFSGVEDKVGVEFARSYQQAYGRAPQTYPEALMYDSIRILKSVIEKDAPKSRDAMREGLRRVQNFPGATGKISFASSNDAERRVRILSIKDGNIVEVPPPDAKSTPKGG